MGDVGEQHESEAPDRSGGPAESPSVREAFERFFLLTVGAAALTKDRLEDMADGVVSRGRRSSGEGRDLVEDLAARSKTEAREAFRGAGASLESLMREIGVAPLRTVEELEFAVRRLEHRVRLVEKAADASDDA